MSPADKNKSQEYSREKALAVILGKVKEYGINPALITITDRHDNNAALYAIRRFEDRLPFVVTHTEILSKNQAKERYPEAWERYVNAQKDATL